MIPSLACTPQEGVPPCTGSEQELDLELSGDCSPEAVLASSPREKLQHDLNTFTSTIQRLRVVGPDAHGGGRGSGPIRVGAGRVGSNG